MPNPVQAAAEGMRTDTHTTDQLLIDACKDVEGLRHGVNLLAKTLAGYMEKLHGGSWRVQIEHSAEAAMVLVVPRLEKAPVATTQLRRAV